jgi:hypothetical protein
MVRKDYTENMNQIPDVVVGHEDGSSECCHPVVGLVQGPHMNMEAGLDTGSDWSKKVGLGLMGRHVDWDKGS